MLAVTRRRQVYRCYRALPSTTASIPECRSMAHSTVIATRSRLIRRGGRAGTRFEIPGTTRPAVLPNLERTFGITFLDISTAPAPTEFTRTSTTIQTELATGERRWPQGDAEDELSMGWRSGTNRYAGGGFRRDFTFFLRIPGWADQGQVSVNGKGLSGVTPGSLPADSPPLVGWRHSSIETGSNAASD